MELQAHQFIAAISAVARNFKRGEGHNFNIFLGTTKLKLIEKQEKL